MAIKLQLTPKKWY